MVSASHNPFGDNGIKLFGAGGTKLAAELEIAIQDELDHCPRPRAGARAAGGAGRRSLRLGEGRGRPASVRCRPTRRRFGPMPVTSPVPSKLGHVSASRSWSTAPTAPRACRAGGARAARRPPQGSFCRAERHQHQRRVRLDAPRAIAGGCGGLQGGPRGGARRRRRPDARRGPPGGSRRRRPAARPVRVRPVRAGPFRPAVR